MNWIKFVTEEDLAYEVGVGCEVLVFDGCNYSIDYVETEVEHGSYLWQMDLSQSFTVG